ncbi:glycosyltransferase family 4 protein [Shewanella frigidimarina]|uniref:glycosyltransferase family 4 protein n=1 Tax=Shewanella frigidimarina TaxID=56812 RepID=UPI000F4EE81F|nr:glycosyltransferase family 4 protein [Shewanella frigidimarina]RPA38317.1 glycosyltransferase [Shewanella frigidimarina]
MSKKKILIISPLPPPVHGMSIATEYIINELKLSGYWFLSYVNTATSKKIESTNQQGKIKFFKIIFFIKNILKGLYRIISLRPDILYVAIPQSFLGYCSYLPYILLAKILSSKVIIHFHGAKFNKLFNNRFYGYLLVKVTIIFVDRVIVLGQSIKYSLINIFPENMIEICENGVFRPESIPVTSVNTEKRNILFLSNLMESKGILVLLRCLKNNPCLFDRFTVTICGQFDGRSVEIKSLLHELSASINFKGPVYGSAKDKVLRSADIFVLPSFNEGQPLSILEAYMYGCCVITTTVGGIVDIFQDKLNGYKISVNDPECLFEKLWGLQPHEVIKIGIYNRNFAFEKFSIKSFVNRVESVFIKVLRNDNV